MTDSGMAMLHERDGSRRDVFMARMQEDGFFILPGIVDAGLVERLRDGLDLSIAICAQAQRNAGLTQAQGTAHHLPAVLGGPFLEYLEANPAHAYISEFFGGKPYILSSMGGQINTATNYAAAIHRDIRSYWHDRVMLNTMVCLDEFSESSGGTLLMRGSHAWMVQKPTDEEFGRNAVQVCAPVGSVVLFDSRVWHKAGENRSGKPRRLVTPLYSVPAFKPGFDYVRGIGIREVERMSETLKQQLGWNSRVPASLYDWYAPTKEARLYRWDQG